MDRLEEMLKEADAARAGGAAQVREVSGEGVRRVVVRRRRVRRVGVGLGVVIVGMGVGIGMNWGDRGTRPDKPARAQRESQGDGAGVERVVDPREELARIRAEIAERERRVEAVLLAERVGRAEAERGYREAVGVPAVSGEWVKSRLEAIRKEQGT